MDDTRKYNYSAGIADVLDKLESAIYLLVAIFLGIMALMTFFIIAQSLTQFSFEPVSEAASTINPNLAIINNALNDILITLIIAGLIQTVIVYIKIHSLDLRLILGVGLTAMIRRVLVFGVETNITWEDIIATAILILVLIIGIYMIGGTRVQHKQEEEEAKH